MRNRKLVERREHRDLDGDVDDMGFQMGLQSDRTNEMTDSSQRSREEGLRAIFEAWWHTRKREPDSMAFQCFKAGYEARPQGTVTCPQCLIDFEVKV